MALDWILELHRQGPSAKAKTIVLTSRDPETGQGIDVIPACSSVEEFAQAVRRLKERLDGLVEEAEKRWSELNGTAPVAKLFPPEAWRKMEGFASEEEMFEYFNQLPEPDRQEIAEYVFSHVNMFKGRGPVFSRHYDAATHVLE